MGRQCNIILTYYSEGNSEHIDIINLFKKNRIPVAESNIGSNSGNRSFCFNELYFHLIAMKDWENQECELFIKELSEIKWEFPESVQVYWQPAVRFDKNYEKFILT